jgi:hypothetical protein
LNSEARATPALHRSPALALGLTALFLAFLLVPAVNESAGLRWSFLAAGALLGTWALILWALPGRRRRGFGIERVPPVKAHYIQACLQLSIYAYWGSYWPKVLPEAPLILAQLVYMYAFDALLNWSRGRNWRPGFGPLPIIFSLNLFLWFRHDWYYLQFVLVSTCALGKEFVRWTREGRSTHIFNPAVFGLGLFSVVLIATGTTIEYTRGIELSTTLSLPPLIYLEIFALGLVVQYLFSVTLMTFSAMVALVLLNMIYTGSTGVYQFVDTNIPIAIFLGLHLLMTDPATSPRTNTGRVIFGTLYGLGSFYFYGVLRDLGAPEFYDKLLTVPVMNLSVQLIDRVARMGLLGRFDRWQAAFDPRRSNLVYMGGWITMFAVLLATGFVQGEHPGASVDFWRKAAGEGKPRAVDNVLKMLRASAERGSGEASNDLGELFLKGKLVERNELFASNYFAQACDQGHPRGCVNLVAQFLAIPNAQPGELVQRALTVLENECGRKTPRRGCYLVGVVYEQGRGRPRDVARAVDFYTRSASRGSLDASKALARLSILGQAPEVEAAVTGLERGCEQDDAESCMFLAYLSQAGAPLERDEARSRALLERACELGWQDACGALSRDEPWRDWLVALRAPRPVR